jgi:hypothetical protein
MNSEAMPACQPLQAALGGRDYDNSWLLRYDAVTGSLSLTR